MPDFEASKRTSVSELLTSETSAVRSRILVNATKTTLDFTN